jgi:hypothetical protein
MLKLKIFDSGVKPKTVRLVCRFATAAVKIIFGESANVPSEMEYMRMQRGECGEYGYLATTILAL